MKNNKGFTIIELIITIFILSVAIIGVYNAFATMVVLTSNASNRLMAAYLAQEGMEVVRNIRDTNWLKIAEGSDPDVEWTDGLLDCSAGDGGCQADYKTDGTTFSPLISYGGDGDYLRIDSNGFYSYSTGTDTKFKRKIIITPPSISNNYIMNVSVQVIWREKSTILNPAGEEGSITTEEDLYNWY